MATNLDTPTDTMTDFVKVVRVRNNRSAAMFLFLYKRKLRLVLTNTCKEECSGVPRTIYIYILYFIYIYY